MEVIKDLFLSGSPTIYDMCSYVAIMLLLVTSIGSNLEIRKLRKRLEKIEASIAPLSPSM